MGPVIELVQKAYDIIKNPERWAQGYYQKDKDGNHCPWRDGYSFCSLGALHFVHFIDGGEVDSEVYHKAVCIIQRHAEKMFGSEIQTVNDSTPPAIAHQNVLKVYESVIDKFRDRDPNDDEIVEGLPEWVKNYRKKA